MTEEQKGDVFTYGAPKDWKPEITTSRRDVYQFSLKPGEQGVWIGLEKGYTRFWEHRTAYSKRDAYPKSIRFSFYTCPEPGCPLCSSQDFDYYETCVTTVLDATPYKKEDGTVLPVARRLLRTKTSMMVTLNDLWHKAKQDLRGIKVDARHTGGKKQVCGDQWFPDISKRYDLSKMIAALQQKFPRWEPREDLLVPVVMKEMQPALAPEQLEKVARGEAVSTGQDDEGSGATEGLDFDSLVGGDSGGEKSGSKDEPFDFGDLPF